MKCGRSMEAARIVIINEHTRNIAPMSKNEAARLEVRGGAYTDLTNPNSSSMIGSLASAKFATRRWRSSAYDA